MRCIAGRRGFVMRFKVSPHLCSCDYRRPRRAWIVARAGAGAGGQFLQLVELHGAGGAGGFHKRNRHQGRLRYVRRQRDAGDAAAGGEIGLRRRGSHRVFSAAPGFGEYFPETRQVEAAEPRQRVAGGNPTPCHLRSRQQFWRQLYVGHHRHRLQCESGAENSRPRCQNRQLGHRLQAGEPGEIQGMRHSHAGFRRRYSSRCARAILDSIPIRPNRPTSKRPPILSSK